MARIKYRLPDNIQQGVKFRVPANHPLKSIRKHWLWYIGPVDNNDRHLVYSVNYQRYGLRLIAQEDLALYSDLRVLSHDLCWPSSWGSNTEVPITQNRGNMLWLTTKELHLCAFESKPKFKGLSLFLLKHDLLPGEKKEEDKHLVYTREMHIRGITFDVSS